jgi:hypothetical protein
MYSFIIVSKFKVSAARCMICALCIISAEAHTWSAYNRVHAQEKHYESKHPCQPRRAAVTLAHCLSPLYFTRASSSLVQHCRPKDVRHKTSVVVLRIQFKTHAATEKLDAWYTNCMTTMYVTTLRRNDTAVQLSITIVIYMLRRGQ